MKKIIVLLFLFSNSAISQWKLEQIPEKNFALGSITTIYLNGLNMGVEGTLQLPRHWIGTAVAVNPISAVDFYKNWAFNFNYSYFPNGSANRFDLFFTFNYIFGIRDQDYTITDLSGNILDDGKIDSNSDVSIGFGFNTNLSQRLFLKTGLGGGMYFATHRDENWMNISANLTISLGYRFGGK